MISKLASKSSVQDYYTQMYTFTTGEKRALARQYATILVRDHNIYLAVAALRATCERGQQDSILHVLVFVPHHSFRLSRIAGW